MAMMGSWQKKPLFKGPFDGGIGTPGYGDGLPMNDAPQWDGVNRLDFTMPEMPTSEAAPRQSFFGKGGAGRDALGVFFDSIAQQTGGQAVYMPTRQHEKDRQQALEDYNRKMSDEMDLWRQKVLMENDGELNLWKRKEEWKAEHPDPVQKTETERLIDMWHSLPENDPRKPVIARALRGSSYDPTVYQPKQDYVTDSRLRIKTTPPAKAASNPAAKIPSGFILD